mgnify:CR=1 FL=1
MNKQQTVEVEQLKADLKRLIGKSKVNCPRLRHALDYEAFSQWVAIECQIRMYLDQLNKA